MHPRRLVLLVFLTIASAPVVSRGDWYVDGGCRAGGDGTVLAPCAAQAGAPGPFVHIAEGLAAVRPGDTVWVRGRHDLFDGVYRGEHLAVYGARALDCRSARCAVRGYGEERPVVSGFLRARDWQRTAPGSVVWYRNMEHHDECQGLGESGAAAARHDPDADWDPQLIVQTRGTGRTPLQYDPRVGTAAAVEARLGVDGSWWHDLAAHRTYVNPYGTGDPNRDEDTGLLVPQEQAQLVIDGTGTCGDGPARVTHGLTIAQLDFEGPRSKFVEVSGRMGEPATGIRLENVGMRFMGGRYALHTQWVRDFGIARSVTEWIGRGLSWGNHAHAFRMFHLDGATLEDVTCRHFGTDNRGERTFLDPPWAAALTPWWWGGTCIQVKQSNDVRLANVVAEDLSLIAIALDVSRRVVIDGFDIRRAAGGIDVQEFTPAPAVGCDERNPAHFCHNHDHVIRNGRIHATGMAVSGAIALSPGARDRRKKLQPGQETATITNVAISYPGGAALRVRDLDGVSVDHLVVYGDLAALLPRSGRPWPRAKGIVVQGDVRRFRSRHGVFAGLQDAAIEAVPAPAGGEVSFDYDLFDVDRAPLVRWGGRAVARLDGPSGVQALGQEAHGRVGPADFARVPGTLASPPDLRRRAPQQRSAR